MDEVTQPSTPEEKQALKNVVEAFYSVIGKLPHDVQGVLGEYWGNGAKLQLVLSPDLLAMQRLGACSNDALKIGISPLAATFPQRGLEILLAHEIGHAFRIAKGIHLPDSDDEEIAIDELLDTWGFENAEVGGFWEAYAESPKPLQRQMKSALMRKDRIVLDRIAETKKNIREKKMDTSG
jgi:hypothetical protein